MFATDGAALYVLKRVEARFEERLGAMMGRADSSDVGMVKCGMDGIIF